MFTGFVVVSARAEIDMWKCDPAHSSAQFSVRHMGISTVRGVFTKVTGTIQYDPADLSKTVIDVSIDAASVDTRVEMRDKELRGANFFDVEKYPTITFKSKKVDKAGTGKMKIAGDITMHGVTKEVVLDVEGPTDQVKDPKGGMHMSASASTKVSRKDFGISGYPGMVGDDIKITIETELAKVPAGH